MSADAAGERGITGGTAEGEPVDERAHRRAEAIRATKALSLGAVLGLVLAWWARAGRKRTTTS